MSVIFYLFLFRHSRCVSASGRVTIVECVGQRFDNGDDLLR